MIEKVKAFLSKSETGNKESQEKELRRKFDDLYRQLHSIGETQDEIEEVVDLELLLNKIELVRQGELELNLLPDMYGEYPLRSTVERLLSGEEVNLSDPAQIEEVEESEPYTLEEMELFGDLFKLIDLLPEDELVTSKGEVLVAMQLKNRIIKVSDGEVEPDRLPRELGQGPNHFVLRDVVVDRVAKARGGD